MRTIKTEIKVYSFDELSEDGKQEALENLYDINVSYEWWDCTYEDAKNVGIKITSFDLGRGSYCKGEFINSSLASASAIIKEHGEACETYKTAKEFLSEWDALVLKHSDGIKTNIVSYENEAEFDSEVDELEKEFLYSILEDYRTMLERNYEYYTSEEAIIETIQCNEYEFTEDGAIF